MRQRRDGFAHEGRCQPNGDWMLEEGMVAPSIWSVRESWWLEEVVVVTKDGGRPVFSWGFGPLTDAEASPARKSPPVWLIPERGRAAQVLSGAIRDSGRGQRP
jgi:hypothetical protein